MESIEVNIADRSYVVRGDDCEEHLKEVAELVRRRIESLQKKNTSLNLQKASMLAAFEFASDIIKDKKKAVEYRSTILSKASSLLEQVENELSNPSN